LNILGSLITLILSIVLSILLFYVVVTPAAPTTHHVAPHADCGAATPCYATLQSAIDVAHQGSEK
jgi:hypothetical protein